MYGGSLIPHVRSAGSGESREGFSPGTPTVAFVGTPRPHKGVDVLRSAISVLAPEGFRLEVTANAPSDAMPHELWHGVTSLNRGLEIVRGADIVAVPSCVAPTTRAQFPVKIVDALIAGRPMVASAVGPIPWAVGDGGVLVPPGDVDALVVALRRLGDPLDRHRIGALGRRHGCNNFTPEAVAATFSRALDATPSLGSGG